MGAGIFSLGSALIGAIGARQTNKASISAASDLNEKNRKWQHNEADLARKASATEAAADRKFQKNQAATAREWSEKMTNQEQQFELNMSNTAHQREMQDLQAAGLNPILAANSGASMPSVNVPSTSIPSGAMAAQPGAGAPSGSSNMPQLRNVLGDFVHSAQEGMHIENDVKRADADLMKAEADKKRAETDALRRKDEVLERISRIDLNYSQSQLNMAKRLGEEKLAKKLEEETAEIIQRKNDNHELSIAQREAIRTVSRATAANAYAQAGLASTRAQLEKETNPAKIKSLEAQAEKYESDIEKNNWVMDDPREVARRKFWKENPDWGYPDQILSTTGNVFHGSASARIDG